MKKTKLLKITKYLDTLEEKYFDYSTVLHRCGTIGCMIGHLPNIFPEEYKYDEDSIVTLVTVDDCINWEIPLGLTEKELSFISEPNDKVRNNYLRKSNAEYLKVNANSTAKEVSNLIKYFIKNYDKIKQYLE